MKRFGIAWRLGVSLALIGVMTMVAASTELGHLLGGLACFIMVIFFAFMVVMARRPYVSDGHAAVVDADPGLED